jgi:hypothetical protein
MRVSPGGKARVLTVVSLDGMRFQRRVAMESKADGCLVEREGERRKRRRAKRVESMWVLGGGGRAKVDFFGMRIWESEVPNGGVDE